MTELMVPYESGASRYRSMNWRKVFDEDAGRSSLTGTSLFTPLEFTQFSHVTKGSMETMLDRVASVSFVASLGGSERDELLAKMRALYLRELKDGVLAMPYETHIFTCFKI